MANDIKEDQVGWLTSIPGTPGDQVVPQTPVAESKEEAAPKTETIEVPADVLQQILDHNKKMEQEVSILREAVNQNRLIDAENKAKPSELPRGYLKVLNGKPVIGWKSVQAKILHNPLTGLPSGEVLKAIFFFLDGTNSGEVDQVDFTRTEEREFFRVKDKKDGNVWLIEFENPQISPRQIEISTSFVNP